SSIPAMALARPARAPASRISGATIMRCIARASEVEDRFALPRLFPFAQGAEDRIEARALPADAAVGVGLGQDQSAAIGGGRGVVELGLGGGGAGPRGLRGGG